MTRWFAIMGLSFGLLGWTGCAEQAETDQPSVESGAKAPGAPSEGVVEPGAAEAGAGAPVESSPEREGETPE
jgi:hypothetical protein